MSTLQPTREDESSFGPWTVGQQACDPVGDATRPATARLSRLAVERLVGAR